MEFALFCTILIILVFILRSFWIKRERRNYPPSPPSLPVIGHLHLLKEPMTQTLQSLSAKYGGVLSLKFGVRRVLVVTSPAAVEECFGANDVVFANRPSTLSTKHFSYNNTTISIAPYGDHWRNLRRLAALEIFSPARIAAFAATRSAEVVLLMRGLLSGGGAAARVDLKSKFIELSFNVLSMTIAGKRYYGENVGDAEEARRVRFIMREMLEHSGNTNLGDLLPFLQWFDFGGLEKRFTDLMEKLDKFMQELVDERRRETTSFQNTMIDHLLSLQEKEPEYYTDELIKGIILVS